MDKITPYDYHSDTSKHGGYQYLPLKEVVKMIEFDYSDDDHILKHIRRSRILNHVKNGIREYNKQVFKDVLAMEITVPENLVVVIPHNYVDYVRVSLIVGEDGDYKLEPLNINTNVNIADAYLQDHNSEILFDSDGGILTADFKNVYNKPFKKYEFCANAMGGHPELDTSKLSKYGEFTIDKRRGKISFSSDLYNQDIVLEYVSDGLSFDTYGDDAIKINKDLVKLIKEYVYYECVSVLKNVSFSEKERARRKLRTEEHKAKVNMANLDLLEISKAMRSASKNL